MHADDGFDRQVRDYEVQYFHLDRQADIELPAGPATIVVWHGPEYRIERVSLDLSATESNEASVQRRASQTRCAPKISTSCST